MRALLALLLVAGVPAAALAQAQDAMTRFAADDPELRAAIDKARAGLPVFFGHVTSPGPGETGFMVKFDLLPEPARAEYIWAEIVSRKPGVTVARLANPPADPRFKLGQQVTVTDAEVADWGYWKDGVLQGAQTMRVQIARMPAAEAAAQRKALGW